MQATVDRTDKYSVNRVLTATLDDYIEIARALSTQLRIDMFRLLLQGPLNVAEIADRFGLPVSTAAVNIKKLEDAGLIITDMVPGTRGTQKLCAAVISRIVLEAMDSPKKAPNSIEIPMPLGQFVDCNVTPTCGIVSATGIIGEYDQPASFYEPERSMAQLLWFKSGYVEYRFPNRISPTALVQSLELTMEVCSEAPLYNDDWPSDITVWINGVEIGTWTSPGDFGGERGYLTPEWWGVQHTQFGLLKTWRVDEKASFIDGRHISNIGLADLGIGRAPFIPVRIGVKPGAANEGGINLFGRGFGNYETDLMMRIGYAERG
ncbi:MAG: helix-turn-helix domain-containing protein [Firmicutes bacterium]|nr:helix-turn-helix domain-containing protein [Bacillota bacterium]